ncbi:hypothetical protein GIB67_013371 [Kingdonia uniflora]|uniref:Glycosyltransferase 61 catalytic domain-containing protein n=1 Tax=Kingdonia uniflora TaxID=39325 RepID=A0A7J7LR44_9MAGN|nr:hypothetical protein GIB67_013371 [Kingdonia uniflora]
MSKRRAFLLKILIFLFALNSISLCFYFSSHPIQLRHHKLTENHQTLTENRKTLTKPQNPNPVPVNFHGKPWPILPSYLPWTLNPNVRPRSCEGYFGNGFNRRIDVIESPSSNGWFRCFYSETLGSSICEGGRVRMDPEKIEMSMGGEDLASVIGRSEEDELPSFELGAFGIEVGEEGGERKKLVNMEFLDRFLPEGDVQRHTMRGLVDSMELVGSDEFKCDQWIEDPTLLVTRFEYANLFHTVTDWYSAYVASRVMGLPTRPHLVFMDGHCKTPLEDTWRRLFSTLRYAKSFNASVCFRHVILSPLGYETALFKGLTEIVKCDGASARDLWQNPDDRKTARLSEFGEMVRASFGFPVDRKMVIKAYNILFVRREDYLAHPRHRGRVESRLSNEQELFDSLKNWTDNNLSCKVNLVNGLFAHMPLKEQVRAIQDASVIIGAHGAGLTHIIAATPKTVILEIISAQYRRPHFALISQWKGLEYHAINLLGSYAEPKVVINKFSSIMQSIGCAGIVR